MSRSRYTITEPDMPHFVTCTVMEWLPVFSHPDAVAILLASWGFLREQKGLRLYGYVVMENHTHFIAQSEHLDKCLASFKSFTGRKIISWLEANGRESLLSRLGFCKKAFKNDRDHQFWQEGVHAELVLNESMMREKLDYIHVNPVRRGYVDKPEQWRYSSARSYTGEAGLIEMDRWW
ncbi:REP-associated tyrosine transposase [Geomonas oryzae]|uniref:REP-associated tyrosine transposase n=1 Tax=Geomonas oryzae TaxID=2364273 RepID=UPI00100BD2D9|nr:transposase [Geomonas oryzae]